MSCTFAWLRILEGVHDQIKQYSFIYLNFPVISTAIAIWFPYTLFPIGLWYYTCLTCFGAFSFLSIVSFSSLISRNASLSCHFFKSWFIFYSLNSWRSTLPRSWGPLRPLSAWTQHSLWSLATNLSFYTFPSLGSLRSGKTGFCRHSIWAWNVGKTSSECRFLKIKILLSPSGISLWWWGSVLNGSDCRWLWLMSLRPMRIFNS